MGKASREKWERRLAFEKEKASAAVDLVNRSDSTGRRLLNFIEHPLFTASFGIFGGIIGLIYLPFLIIPTLLVGWAFHRSGVVKGRSIYIKVISHLVILGLSASFYRWSMMKIRKSVTAIPTLDQIEERVWRVEDRVWRDHSEHSQPAFHAFEAASVPKKGPWIQLDEPMTGASDGKPLFSIGYTNIGDETARASLNTGGVFVRTNNKQSEDAIFRFLHGKEADTDPNISQSDIGQGFKHRGTIPLVWEITPDEKTQLQQADKAAYVAFAMTYYDSTGIQHVAESCWLYSPRYSLLGKCIGHNLTR